MIKCKAKTKKGKRCSQKGYLNGYCLVHFATIHGLSNRRIEKKEVGM